MSEILLSFKSFLIVGIFSVAIDWSLFLVFAAITEFPSSYLKTVSFFVGTLFSFVTNAKYTFNHETSFVRLVKHLTIYIISMLANTFTFSSIYSLFTRDLLWSFMALTIATLVSMLINFIGLKFYVFSEKGM